jgi:hypothetical protein
MKNIIPHSRIICFPFLLAICFVAFYQTADSADDYDFGRIDQTQNMSAEIFLRIYNEYGLNWRIESGLEACGKKGLSQQFVENTEERQDKIAKIFSELENLKYRDSRAMLDMILRVDGTIIGYKIGYGEAFRMLQSTSPKICEKVINLADKQLLEKKKK